MASHTHTHTHTHTQTHTHTHKHTHTHTHTPFWQLDNWEAWVRYQKAGVPELYWRYMKLEEYVEAWARHHRYWQNHPYFAETPKCVCALVCTLAREP